MKVVMLGLSITSSWGNGHATNYRALVKALARSGHDVLFLERDVPWYAEQRDLPHPPWGRLALYDSIGALEVHREAISAADLVVVGSFVPEGVRAAEQVLAWSRGIVAFFDIDTPITLRKLAAGDEEYLAARLVPQFDLYLSFTGGPALDVLQETHGARRAEPFYCFVDPEVYVPVDVEERWCLTYLGTYSDDRQPKVEELLFAPARALPERAFALGGPLYPAGLQWPPNVRHLEHVPPAEHPSFYAAGSFTLNVTREQMVAAGYAPSVRLFEAAACGVPVISDRWPGIETFFRPGHEIFLADDAEEVVRLLIEVSPEERRRAGAAARRVVLEHHTAERRVEQLETLIGEGARV